LTAFKIGDICNPGTTDTPALLPGVHGPSTRSAIETGTFQLMGTSMIPYKYFTAKQWDASIIGTTHPVNIFLEKTVETDTPEKSTSMDHRQYTPHRERLLSHLEIGPLPIYPSLKENFLANFGTAFRGEDRILDFVSDGSSRCVSDFIKKSHSPIPMSKRDARPLAILFDAGWAECWAEYLYLSERLATKRRVPARISYDGQIRQQIALLKTSPESALNPCSTPRWEIKLIVSPPSSWDNQTFLNSFPNGSLLRSYKVQYRFPPLNMAFFQACDIFFTSKDMEKSQGTANELFALSDNHIGS